MTDRVWETATDYNWTNLQPRAAGTQVTLTREFGGGSRAYLTKLVANHTQGGWVFVSGDNGVSQTAMFASEIKAGEPNVFALAIPFAANDDIKVNMSGASAGMGSIYIEGTLW